MKVSRQDLIEIIERASTMSDRKCDQFVSDPLTDNQLIETRLKKLVEITAKDDSDKFNKYLQWEGLDLNILRQSLGKVSYSDVKKLPSWAKTLEAVLQATIFPHLLSVTIDRNYNEFQAQLNTSKLTNLQHRSIATFDYSNYHSQLNYCLAYLGSLKLLDSMEIEQKLTLM